MVKWLELFVLPIIRVQKYWICNLPVKTHGTFNVIPEASTLRVMQMGSLALKHRRRDLQTNLRMTALGR